FLTSLGRKEEHRHRVELYRTYDLAGHPENQGLRSFSLEVDDDGASKIAIVTRCFQADSKAAALTRRHVDRHLGYDKRRGQVYVLNVQRGRTLILELKGVLPVLFDADGSEVECLLLGALRLGTQEGNAQQAD